MSEPEPEHGRTPDDNASGGDHNEHWDWGRSDGGDE